MNQILEACLREFERSVEAWVEQDFEIARALRDRINTIPHIGGDYCPLAPRESHVALKQKVVRALCSQRHFLYEPSIPCELPLRFEECLWLAEFDDERYAQVGRYALWQRELDWRDWPEWSFAEFCKKERAPPTRLTVHRGGLADADLNVVPLRPGPPVVKGPLDR